MPQSVIVRVTRCTNWRRDFFLDVHAVRAVKIFGSHNISGQHGPGFRHFDLVGFEHHLAFIVLDDGAPLFPFDFVEGVNPRGG